MTELEREMAKTPKITATFAYGEASELGDMPNNWKVTLKFKKRKLTTDFYGGELVENPTTADVLSCLISDALAGDQDFEDYCKDFGYCEDSFKAYQTWEACAATVSKLNRFLSDDAQRFAGLDH